MKSFIALVFLLVYISFYCQNNELTNKKLISYYEAVNSAEDKIVANELDSADFYYQKAFKIFKEPHANDLYNHMKVLLNKKNYENAFKHYQSLDCMKYKFEENFLSYHFPNSEQYKKLKCKNKFDDHYRKELDSLFMIDQHYRKLSGGNYAKFKKEITKNDSIASTKLLSLIQKKEFPNEYDLGLSSANLVFFQNFYFIIWHQLATNLYSPQVVNFSDEIIKALNKGKITPENAAFLLDLNNGTQNYSSRHFDIVQIFKNEGNPDRPHDKAEEMLEKADCCYVHQWFYPEKRGEKGNALVKDIDRRRKSIGMSTLDQSLRKKVFLLTNKEYKMGHANLIGMDFQNDEDAENLKKHFIKIN